MKKKLIALVFLLIFQFNYSQENGVEKSLFDLQIGPNGIWVNNETKISNSFALRSEIGLNSSVILRGSSTTNVFSLTPVVVVEPRWYYNFKNRTIKNKNTIGNSVNFLTVSIVYRPDSFVISNYDNINFYEQLAFVPKWGIRRKIGTSNFNYEVGLGLGYRYVFLKKYGFTKNNEEAFLDLHLRIGYTFNNKKNNTKKK